ncbi:WXG100 family type VII secretion target [Micromonospora sp. NBC_00821]|uniref:WXG100 family type VII secretion target n=1 Tax=Micromonospora sp. NBC_00821 TaxID=2975977 RepID=UPI002ED28B5E|nr:WXG100 family type VII secretion target [Micromonospora sp. NBC_00821]
MTVNPLIATASDTSPSAWAGIWICEDIELIAQGISNGSWIDGSLGVVSAGLDALALVSDPVGALLQYGIAWLIEHVKPLSEALDWLAGNPAEITAHAQTWRNVAASLREEVTALAAAVRNDVAAWGGSAGLAYRNWAGEQQQAIIGLAQGAETLAAITEGAAGLVAAVRLLVRDAIATCVSRLIVYAGELLLTGGLAAPLVVEQVATLVASWGARIARMLRGLLASLRQLIPLIRRLGELIEKLKQALKKLGAGDSGTPKPRPGRGERQELLDELSQAGIKHNPEQIVAIGRNRDGKIVFLETGNDRAGLAHITSRHADDFAKVGVPEEKIPDLVFTAVTRGEVVGTQRTRPIYEVLFEGRTYKLAVSVGNNGFIVGANPVGR